MKKTLLLLILLITGLTTQAQFIATVQMDEEVEGICDHDKVYALFAGFDGQVPAKCSVSKNEMEQLLNEQLQFLKDNPKFRGKGMVGVYINCEGETLQWSVSVKTGNADLDKEILEIFQSFSQWEAGTLDGELVDTHELFSYEIKKGILKIN